MHQAATATNMNATAQHSVYCRLLETVSNRYGIPGGPLPDEVSAAFPPASVIASLHTGEPHSNKFLPARLPFVMPIAGLSASSFRVSIWACMDIRDKRSYLSACSNQRKQLSCVLPCLPPLCTVPAVLCEWINSSTLRTHQVLQQVATTPV